jgi:hypothetical protein
MWQVAEMSVIATGMPFQPDIEHGADQYPGIQRHRFARLEVNLGAGVLLQIEQELNQLIALVIGCG